MSHSVSSSTETLVANAFYTRASKFHRQHAVVIFKNCSDRLPRVVVADATGRAGTDVPITEWMPRGPHDVMASRDVVRLQAGVRRAWPGSVDTAKPGDRERAEPAGGKVQSLRRYRRSSGGEEGMETIGNLDAGQLVTAGKVEEIKATAKKAAEDQVAAAAQASNEMICGTHQGSGRTAECTFHRKGGGAFSRSKFITDKLAVPADMVQAKFGITSRLRTANYRRRSLRSTGCR